MFTKTKILFTDLDDTLLNRKKQITPQNADAIEEALEKGHRIVINTGRPLIGALEQIQALHLERKGCYAITYNGGLIYDCYTHKTIYKKAIPLPYVHHIFQQTAKAGIHCQTYDAKGILSAKETSCLQRYSSKTGVPYRIIPDLPYSMTEEPVKILAIDDEHPQKLHAYRESLTEWAENKISVFFSSTSYLEHVANGVSKGAAMKILCEILDIPLINTISVGDAENDIPMIQTAHIGAAMKNATPQVKAVADYITENDCENSGFAEVIRKFLLT
ncbi:MAG: Cof-type HAD-IIB family hydrolase [Lachnospiraceae bacterium]|jgi:Cof subfamily protein (haloacid dehalogenase superfamily)